MLELLSAGLSAASLLVNLKNKKGQGERRDDLLLALEQAEGIFAVLRRAKDYHDEYQVLQVTSLQTLISGLDNDTEPDAKQQHIAQFLRLVGTLIHPERVHLDASGHLTIPDAIPRNIRDKAEQVARLVPALASALERFKEACASLRELNEDGNYGAHLDRTIHALEDALGNTVTTADKIILDTVPIVDFIHHELRSNISDFV